MSPCPRCGRANRQGTPVCLNCGTRLLPDIVPLPSEDESMPDWLRELQPEQPRHPAAQPPPPPGSPILAYGLPASDLLSPDAMPSWLGEQGQPGMGMQPQDAGQRQPPPQSYMLNQPAIFSHPAPPVQSAAAPPAGFWPATPGSAPAQSLFDESALPDWLRQEGASKNLGAMPSAYPPSPADSSQFVAAPPPPAYPQPTFAPPRPPQPSPMPGGKSGPVLFDPAALPTWLGGQASGGSDRLVGGGEGMAANALVDETALPAWLRAQPERPAAQGVPGVAASPPSVMGNPFGPAATGEAMPAWLNQVYAEAQVPRLPGSQHLGGSPWTGSMGGIPQSPQLPETGGVRPGFPSGDLVDESALPTWLRAQTGTLGGGMGTGGQGTGRGADATAFGSASIGQARRAGTAGSDQPTGMRFSASDLIDPGALPDWVRGQPQTPESTFSSTAGWTQRHPAAQAFSGLPGTGAQPASFGGDAFAVGRAPAPADEASHWGSDGEMQHGLRSDRLARGADDGDFGGRSGPLGRSADSRGGPAESFRGGPRGPGIPESELPPWLRAGAGMDQQAGQYRAPERAAPYLQGGRQPYMAEGADAGAVDQGAPWQPAGYEDAYGDDYTGEQTYAAGDDGAQYEPYGYDAYGDDANAAYGTYYDPGYDDNGYGRHEEAWGEWEDEQPKRGWKRFFGRR